MLVKGCKITINMSLSGLVLNWIKEILNQLKTQEMCKKGIRISTASLLYVSDKYKSHEMHNEVMLVSPASFYLISDYLKMCIKAVEEDTCGVFYVLDHFKTQDMFDDAVRCEDPYLLLYVPDWFATQEQVKIWHIDDDYYNDNEIVECYYDLLKRVNVHCLASHKNTKLVHDRR